jgi:hypothetical protein
VPDEEYAVWTEAFGRMLAIDARINHIQLTRLPAASDFGVSYGGEEVSFIPHNSTLMCTHEAITTAMEANRLSVEA